MSNSIPTPVTSASGINLLIHDPGSYGFPPSTEVEVKLKRKQIKKAVGVEDVPDHLIPCPPKKPPHKGKITVSFATREDAQKALKELGRAWSLLVAFRL